MHKIIIGIGALIVGSAAAAQQAGPKAGGGRHVERIAMVEATAAASPVRRDAAAPPPVVPADPGFRVHDLSRRWVEFQMANEWAAPAVGVPARPDGQTGQGGVAAALAEQMQNPGVAPITSISVPAWMRGGPVFAAAALRYAPQCSTAPYRMTGFLRSDAEGRRAAYYGLMSSIACEYGIPGGLFDALIIQESRYRANIVSPKNAFGLTQLMPDTALALGVDRYRAEDNLRGGAQYLRQQLDRFGQVHLALAAYNAGPGRVVGGRLPPIQETRAYVDAVLANWSRLTGAARHAQVATPAGQSAASEPSTIGRRAAVTAF